MIVGRSKPFRITRERTNNMYICEFRERQNDLILGMAAVWLRRDRKYRRNYGHFQSHGVRPRVRNWTCKCGLSIVAFQSTPSCPSAATEPVAPEAQLFQSGPRVNRN